MVSTPKPGEPFTQVEKFRLIFETSLPGKPVNKMASNRIQ